MNRWNTPCHNINKGYYTKGPTHYIITAVIISLTKLMLFIVSDDFVLQTSTIVPSTHVRTRGFVSIVSTPTDVCVLKAGKDTCVNSVRAQELFLLYFNSTSMAFLPCNSEAIAANRGVRGFGWIYNRPEMYNLVLGRTSVSTLEGQMLYFHSISVVWPIYDINRR